jgi:hypothetical protein
MSYFKPKVGLGTTYADRFKSKMVAGQFIVGAVKPSQAAGITAMAKIKAEWPKKTVTVRVKRDGVEVGEPTTTTMYVWKFANGTTMHTRAWSNEYYLHVTKGTSPAPKYRVPDLSKVTRGTKEYFKWLCKAQGKTGGAPSSTQQGIRIAFDRMGWSWQWRHDDALASRREPYASVPPGLQVELCANYVARKTKYGYTGTNVGKQDDHWNEKATWYARHGTKKFEESRANATVRDHTPAGKAKALEAEVKACEGKVAPEFVEACKAAIRKGDGTTTDSFKKQLDDMSGQELEDLIAGGPGAGAALPPPPPPSGLFGIPPTYLAAGAVGTILLGAVLLKRKK